MRRAISWGIQAAAALCVATCTSHSESVAEGPPPSAQPAVAPTFPPAPGSVPDDLPGPPPQPPAQCPREMVFVSGEYCTEVRQDCATWEDPPSTPLARCAEYSPSRCVGERVPKRFCIDRDEYVPPGQALPLGDVSWSQARAICQGIGKRLCRETEWEFACEGENMFAYPTGPARDASVCNFDRGDLVDAKTRKLRDQREPPGALDRCLSPFGVRSMSGNVDEWVWRDRTPGPWRSALKGGWWMPGRDRCRPATTAHGENFRQLQTGLRCCADSR